MEVIGKEKATGVMSGEDLPGSECHGAVLPLPGEGKNQVLKEQRAQRRYHDDIAEEVALIRNSVAFKGFGTH